MIQQKTQTWQHEETGRLVDFPFGKNPGRRWYLLPQIKTKNPSRGAKPVMEGKNDETKMC